MSSRNRKSKKSKPDAEDFDFSPPTDLVTEEKTTSKRRRGKNNNNAIVKSRLKVIIDMLSSKDNKLSDDVLRYNVKIAVTHLKEVKELL